MDPNDIATATSEAEVKIDEEAAAAEANNETNEEIEQQEEEGGGAAENNGSDANPSASRPPIEGASPGYLPFYYHYALVAGLCS